METFLHQLFIKYNQLDIQTLPEMLQKRIRGFEEMEEDLQRTTEQDREELMDKLEMLSHELAEDLEEHFEGQLENNDLEEEEEETETIPETLREKQKQEPMIQEAEIQEITEQHHEYKQEPEIKEEAPSQHAEPEPEPVSELKDEEILSELFNDKKDVVLPAELRKKGFKASLNEKTVLVGKFYLYRGKYDTCYKIILKNQ